MRHRRPLGGCAALASALLLGACAAAPARPQLPSRTSAHAPGARAHLATASDAPLAPGDVIALRAPRAPWLEGLYRVDAAGRIVLPELGALEARGRTLAQLARAFDALPDAPEVELAVHARLGARVAIAGEVRRPGMLALDGPTSLTHALATAGGVTYLADAGRVEVVRSRDGVAQRLRVSVPAQGERFVLEPGDSVFVPPATRALSALPGAHAAQP
jgi:polysaccharide export outer membrane protein